MSGPWLVFWLVINTGLFVYGAYMLRSGQKEDRGWYGFWLAMTIHAIIHNVTKLLELLLK